MCINLYDDNGSQFMESELISQGSWVVLAAISAGFEQLEELLGCHISAEHHQEGHHDAGYAEE